MSRRLVIPDTLRRMQSKASNPEASAWVSANAGSGKTHVLTQRVLRLLLAGTPPGQILGLTFTKAAAANMATRIFNTLAQWASLGDEALAAAIVETGAGEAGPAGSHIRPTIVRAHDRDAWRLEDPDSSRLLRKASAALPFRGECPCAFQGDRRARGRGAHGRGAR